VNLRISVGCPNWPHQSVTMYLGGTKLRVAFRMIQIHRGKRANEIRVQTL